MSRPGMAGGQTVPPYPDLPDDSIAIDKVATPLFRSVTLTDDERLGLAFLLGLAPVSAMSFDNVQRSTA